MSKRKDDIELVRAVTREFKDILLIETRRERATEALRHLHDIQRKVTEAQWKLRDILAEAKWREDNIDLVVGQKTRAVFVQGLREYLAVRGISPDIEDPRRIDEHLFFAAFDAFIASGPEPVDEA